METCERCHTRLIEIDNYGQRLIGCYKCNKWRQPGEIDFVRELPEKDFAALSNIAAKAESESDALLETYVAQRNAEALKSYIARGRRFEQLSDTQLAEKFAEGVRQWAGNLKTPNQLDDVNAECELRGIRSLELETVPEFRVIRTAVYRALEDMTEQQAEEIIAEIREVHDNVKKDQQ